MKLKNSLVLFMAFAAITFTSCTSKTASTAKIDIDALKPQIQKMEDAFAAAEKIKDVNAVAVYYSDDAVSYGRNDVPAAGKDAIKAKIAAGFAKDTTNNTSVYKIVDLYADGDLAVEIGSWTSVTPAGEQALKGYYMSVFQKKDSGYQCVRDMNMTVEKPASK